MKNFQTLSERKVLKLLSFIKSSPGVFLETTHFDKQNYKSFLFLKPKKILTFNLGQNLEDFFKEVEFNLSSGFWLAGYFSYEFGYLFEPLLFELLKSKRITFPLAWLGIFNKPLIINHLNLPKNSSSFNPSQKSLKLRLRDECNFSLLGREPHPLGLRGSTVNGSFKLREGFFNMDILEYKKAIGKIKNYLEKGDTYQVNFTLKYKAKFSGDLLNFYLHLRRNQPTSFTAFINDGKRFILSFSPELFFRLKKRSILVKPMKGTYKRGENLKADKKNADFLKKDLKNRAENIMIVDLLRNDLGKIAKEGKVKTLSLFDVERYPSLLQMTSTIKAELKGNVFLKDVFKALFPSGSVTGAPKIRTMRIIENLEKEPRDVYTGGIGFVSPFKEACFNVAIRTLIVEKNRLEFGVGGGIVYDSSFNKEYQECLLKTNFLTKKLEDFSLIETLLWQKGYFKFLELHLRRLKNSCKYFNIPLDLAKLKEKLISFSKKFLKQRKYKVRILVDRKAKIKVSYSLLKEIKKEVLVKLSSKKTDSSNLFLYHKTTQRKLYDEERKKALKKGFFEVIFTNQKGELTEGAVSNIFLLNKNKFYTPALSSGLLPGVLREYLLKSKKAKEKILYPEDIFKAKEVFIGNSVRGLVKAKAIFS